MKATLQILIFIILTINKLLGCDCPPTNSFQAREFSYRHADLVFLGEYVGEDKTQKSNLFTIMDLFKGQTKLDTITAVKERGCSIDHFSKGIWLIYGEYQTDSTITVSLCSATRSFGRLLMFPPLPFYDKKTMSIMDSLSIELSIVKHENYELANLIADIELYRSRKKQEPIKINETNYWPWILGLSLLINMVLFLILIIKKR